MSRLIIHESHCTEKLPLDGILESIVSDPLFSEQNAFNKYRNRNDVRRNFSPLNKNLIAWIDFHANISIGEMGSGYGNHTVHLASIPGSRVTAVEPSVGRSRIIEARCRGFENVEVHACAVDSFEVREPFDILTLIGCLENTGKQKTGAQWFNEKLATANRLVRDDGTVLIALDNTLGYKNQTNPGKDTGTTGQEQTARPAGEKLSLNHAELVSLLHESGFKKIQVVFPFPDYREADLIVSSAGFSTPGFEPLSLMNFPAAPGDSAGSKPRIHEEEYLRALMRNGVAPHFMNSFLVFASRSEKARFFPDSSLLAVRFNSHRAPRFATKVAFSMNNGMLSVKKTRIGFEKSDGGDYAEEFVRHNPSLDNGKYHQGFLSFEAALLEGFRKGEKATITHVVNTWIEMLLMHAEPATDGDRARFEKFSVSAFGKPIYTHVYDQPWIDGTYIDFIPRNILENPLNGETAVIDKEWAIAMKIPLQLVFDRALHHFRGSVVSRQIQSPSPVHFHYCLPMDSIRALENNPLFMMHDRSSCDVFERWFQEYVLETGRRTEAKGITVPAADVAKVSIIVPVFNKAALTRQFIASLEQHLSKTISVECIVVDNASTDDTARVLEEQTKRLPWLRSIGLSENRGYGGANNIGTTHATGSHLLFLNNDMLFFPHWLEPLADAFIDTSVGIASGRLLYPNFTVQHAGIVFRDDFQPLHVYRNCPFSADVVAHSKEYAAVTGACIMIQKKLFEDLKGFDEAYKMYFEDIDLCLKVRSTGRSVVYIPECMLLHLEGKSSPSQVEVDKKNNESRPLFLKRWTPYLSHLMVEQGEMFQQGKRYVRPAGSLYRNSEPDRRQEYPVFQNQPPSLAGFINRIATLVEAGEFVLALQYYDDKRSLFPDTDPELKKVGVLLDKLRSKIPSRQ